MIDLNPKPYTVILALNSGYPIEMERDIIQRNTGLDSKRVVGCYKGSTENSYVVCPSTQEDWVSIMDLARYYKQESVLVLDPDRDAVLYDLTKLKDTKLGKFVHVSERDAKSQDSWTYDPIYDQYFVTKQ